MTNRILEFNDSFTSATAPTGNDGISTWVTAKIYYVDDVVVEGDNIYKCIVGHTSSVFNSDLALLYWLSLSPGATPSVSVASETTYGLSTVVGTSNLYARQDHSHGSASYPALDNLTDVVTPSAFSGDYLKFNGTNWVNQPLVTNTAFVLYVTQNGNDTNIGGILNPLLTISAAITAATSGTTIYVSPGTYPENLTLKAGVNIVGQQSRTSIITGNVIANFSGTVQLHSLDFQASSGVVLTVSGTTALNLQLDDCHIDSLSGASHAVNYTNTNASSKLSMDNGAISVAASTAAKCFESSVGVAGTIIFEDISAKLLDVKTRNCLNISGALSFSHVFDDVHGTITVANTASYNGVNLSIDSGSSAMFTTNSSSISTLVNIVCLSTANPVVTGAGLFAHGAIGFVSTGEGFAATLNAGAGASPIPTSSIQLHSEANTTLPYDGQISYDGTHAYITIGATRYQIDQQVPTSLKSATTTVSIGSATAPTAGQVLTASSPTLAAWSDPTGAGQGGINYITNYAAESNTNGWATYLDAVGTSPIDGTGGVSAITFTRSITSPLRGIASFLLTKNGATSRQGNGFSYDFTIDASDKGKVLQGSFEYQIASGTYADNDLSVWIYETIASSPFSRLIQVAPYLIKNSGIVEKFGFEYQSSIDVTSSRLIIHVSSASALDYTVKFDNFNVGPQAKLYGSAVTDPVAFASTLSNFGNGTASLSYSRVGKRAKIKGTLTIGSTLPTGNIVFSLPAGLSADYSDNPVGIPNSDQYQRVGSATTYTTFFVGAVTRFSTSSNTFSIVSTGGALWTNSTPYTFVAGNTIAIDMEVPIVGWSSSQVMSSDADTRVVAARVYKTVAQTGLTTDTKVTFGGITSDKIAMWDSVNNWYQIKVPGTYRVSASVGFGSVATGEYVRSRYYKNGSTQLNETYCYVPNATDLPLLNSDLYDFVAGDTIEIRAGNNGASFDVNTSLASYFNIERLSGPAQIMASESVSAFYTGAPVTGTLNGTTNMTFGSKVKDSHNAYSGGVYTVPVSGVYDIKATFRIDATYVLNNESDIYIAIDGTSRYLNEIRAGGAVASLHPQVSINSVPLLAGQTVSIRGYTSGTTPTIPAASTVNWFSITRTGNY